MKIILVPTDFSDQALYALKVAVSIAKKIDGKILLISLDLGIGNFKEVKLAKKFGFEVIIIDHHEILDKLPEVEIIVDPKQEEDKYPFKELATAGIVFKLSNLAWWKLPIFWVV